MSEKAVRRLLACAVFLVPLIVYFLTMAPTLTFWDSGEFISACHVLGIPHSPGTPLYVLVGRVFTMLPLPLGVAAKVNLLSVVFSALAVLMAYLVMVATVRFMYPDLKGGLGHFMGYAGPFVGSLYLSFSDTYWRDATEAEVYALSAFVMGLCTYLALAWYRNPAGKVSGGLEPGASVVEEERLERVHSRGLVYLIIYLLALGIGFHLGTVLVFGGIFLLFLMVKEKSFSNVELVIFTFGLAVLLADMTLHRKTGVTLGGLGIFVVLLVWSVARKGKFALAATGLLALGVSVHLYMLIRSFFDPGIDMVDPETWKAMHYHLRREQYPVKSIFERSAPLVWQFQHFGRYFGEQFRMIGDTYLGRVNMGYLLTFIPLLLGLFGIVTNYERERRTWTLNFTNLIVNSIGLVLFLNFSAAEVRERDYFYGPAFYFFAVFIGIGATSLLVTIAEYARSKGKEAARLAVPVGAVLLALSILPARHNWFTHDRSENYIPRDYARNMLAGLEPDAVIFTGGDNDTYPLWYIQNVERYRTDVRVIVCTLLNTDWYIKQMRDREPQVPITMTDGDIARLRPIALRGGGVAWNDDLMIQHIIQAANWKRPIYFATSVAPAKWRPYEQHLETQGLVMRLVPYQGSRMLNTLLMRRNFEHVFSFRGILTEDEQVDDSIFKDKDLGTTLNNYGVAASELANALGLQKDYAGAVHWTEIAIRFAPQLKPAHIMLGTYYALNNERDKGIEYYRRMIGLDPGETEYWLRIAWLFAQGQDPRALQTIDEAIARLPGYRQFYVDGFRYAVQMGNAGAARGYIRRWLDAHPDDGEMAAALGEIDSLVANTNAVPRGAPPGGTGR